MKDTGGTAFPADRVEVWAGERGELISDIGLSKRDYFAAAALTGMMASRNPSSPRFHPEDDAAYVYAVADAMLKERAK